MKSYAEIERLTLQWGKNRGIVDHGMPIGQAEKVVEEAGELLEGIKAGDMENVRLELGDVWVTLVMTAATMDISLIDCMYAAYDKIKDRTGTLGADGVFRKDTK